MSEEKKIAVDEETISVLKELVRLHENWFKGSAYVSVQFEKDNDAAIRRALAIIKGSEE